MKFVALDESFSGLHVYNSSQIQHYLLSQQIILDESRLDFCFMGAYHCFYLSAL